MKTRIIIIILLLFIALSGYPQDYEKPLLSDIANNFSEYSGKTLILKLRLKYIDDIQNKAIFYDSKNYDVVFDIYELKKNDDFKKNILNLKNGMEYIVKFAVKEAVKNNYLAGELIGFEPLILTKLPEGKQKIKKAE